MVSQDFATCLFAPPIAGMHHGQIPLIVTGSVHPQLAGEVAAHLGLNLSHLSCGAFPDGEIRITLHQPVVGAEVFVVQPTCSAQSILELFLLIDALKRSAAGRVTVAVPYFGYARQDRRTGLEPNSAALMARQLETAGADAVILLDIHNPAIEGSFHIPVIPLHATAPFVATWQTAGLDPSHLTVVAPDAGGAKRAEAFCQAAGCHNLAFLHKKRTGAGDCEIYGVSGEVSQQVMLVDDVISSGNTLLKAAQFLAGMGATAIYASVTHLVTTQVFAHLNASPLVRLYVTNSLPTSQSVHQKVQVVSVASELAAGMASLLPGFPARLNP